ncbi:uncharacterized protein [Paramisgurnus dabryanus]|uniref:uncharacterized protein n=1 Tax=Paramisgurnus dabryanus TaxID=90735 RepID=UPI0031F43777
MKIILLHCFLIAIHVMISDERLIVSGSNQSISASVGEDVTLSCSVNSHIKPEEVSWKKAQKDGDILVLLYQNNKNISESPDERYRDRVEFFTDEIHRGNFSLRLKRVRTEDKGVYICQVFTGELSANTTVILERLGFSGLHIMVLILCITACGSALLFCSLINCRSNNTDCSSNFHMSLLFCPNIIMFFAFVFWGVSEGFLNETLTCCALFFLRPLMLLWSEPEVKNFPDRIRHLAGYSFYLEYIIFTVIVFSVLYIWNVRNQLLHYSTFERNMITILFGIMPFMSLIIIIYILSVYYDVAFTGARQKQREMPRIKLNIMAFISFHILPPLQLVLLFYAFGVARGTFLIAGVLPVIIIVARFDWNFMCGKDGLRCPDWIIRTVWFIFTILMNLLLAWFYIRTLELDEEKAGWACLIVFLQILWAVLNFRRSFNHWGVKKNVFVFVVGSVGVVFINTVALMTELILKTVNGERSIGDLRIPVFTSESVFTLCLLILQIYGKSGESDQSETQLRRKPSFTQRYYIRGQTHSTAEPAEPSSETIELKERA